jgi:hypothetical protein
MERKLLLAKTDNMMKRGVWNQQQSLHNETIQFYYFIKYFVLEI